MTPGGLFYDRQLRTFQWRWTIRVGSGFRHRYVHISGCPTEASIEGYRIIAQYQIVRGIVADVQDDSPVINKFARDINIVSSGIDEHVGCETIVFYPLIERTD